MRELVSLCDIAVALVCHSPADWPSQAVQSLGGYQKVTQEKKWGDVAQQLKLKQARTLPLLIIRLMNSKTSHNEPQ